MNQNRRDFLRSSLSSSTLMTLVPSVPAYLCHTALAAGPRHADGNGKVLVVVQLSGGNDGLNCVVPYSDDEYSRRRTTLRLTAREVLRIDDALGFHPVMQASREMLDDGSFGVIQGVGYPKSSRNHPIATRDWQTARPGDSDAPTGWLGRVADQFCDKMEPAALPVALAAKISEPLALKSERAVIPKLHSPQSGVLTAGKADPGYERRLGEITSIDRPEANPMLDYVQTSAAAAWGASARIRETSARAGSARGYPASALGQRLKHVASLIRAEAGFRIFYTDHGGDGFGGFDNHANQKENHAALLKQFSEAVVAFIADLKRDQLDERVVLMTTSDFGRTATENGRGGTGHGAAGPVFIAGGALKGGLTGDHPAMDDLDNDALKFHTDFRGVYATMLDQWLGYDSQAILGARFEVLDLFRG